jgi:hypothetical protein
MTMPDEDVTPDAHLDPDERDLEAPDADAAEQAIPADPTSAEAGTPTQVHRGLDVEREVNEWDAVEQARVVPLDDDDR